MWYPVRTRVSTRQESQFKYTRSNVRQPWSGRAFIKEGNCRFYFNRLEDYLSWSGRAHISYGNCVSKISRLHAHPPCSGRAKPYKEITCSGRATVQTMYRPVWTWLLNKKDFSAKFLENPVAQLSVRTAMTTVQTTPNYILPDAHLSPQHINRGPWALRTARIRN
jgi:hypothetical protein